MFNRLMYKLFATCVAVIALLASCMEYGPVERESFDFSSSSGAPEDGLFLLHEGRFMYGEASLSYYIPSTKELENEVFLRANGSKLGDVAQSMFISGERGFLAVNNSGVVYAIDVNTFQVDGIIRSVSSPRHICFISDTKGYITSLSDGEITIFDPSTLKIQGVISTGEHKSSEEMAVWGKYLFVTCWSYDDCILVIDTETDEIVDTITTRIQPRWIVADKNDMLWVMTDGGYNTGVNGYQPPALYRINPATREIDKEFSFFIGDTPRGLALSGDSLYFLNDDLYKMSIYDDQLPRTAFISGEGKLFYSLGISPDNGDIYIADAIDYSQRGVVYRFSSQGEPIDSFRTGIIPSSFCFK